jgi:hypothetical protein
MAKFKIINKNTKEVIRYGDCAESVLQYQVENENEELVVGDFLDIGLDSINTPTEYSNIGKRAISYPNQFDQLGVLFKFVKYMIEEQGVNPPQEIKDMVARIDEIKLQYPK